MKTKTSKKITLNKETVSILNNQQLKMIVGGRDGEDPKTGILKTSSTKIL